MKQQNFHIYIGHNNWLDYQDNFQNIIKTGSYVGEYKIIKTVNNKKIYEFETIKSNFDRYNPFIPIILITWVSDIHYE